MAVLVLPGDFTHTKDSPSPGAPWVGLPEACVLGGGAPQGSPGVAVGFLTGGPVTRDRQLDQWPRVPAVTASSPSAAWDAQAGPWLFPSSPGVRGAGLLQFQPACPQQPRLWSSGLSGGGTPSLGQQLCLQIGEWVPPRMRGSFLGPPVSRRTPRLSAHCASLPGALSIRSFLCGLG